ncbi:MAG: leucyl/phenylalanyl-tRNA--protein transferase [Ignavibacteriales bacterium]|nr:leucyl/phenylalanyl-tRNA--protein transferase [Ignavibacteriales bacterium]
MSNKNFFSKKESLLPENMILMYARGAFPMADDTGEIDWYMPNVRAIIPLDSFNIPRSLKKFYLSADYEYSFDANSLEVITQCANRESTWISAELIEAYKGLHRLGYLHSVEVTQDGKLVGGLYGIAYRGAFFGESMFSKISQASKCALVKLIERLLEKGFTLLDVQYQTDHLKMFGSKEIPFEEFSNMLFEAYKQNVVFR